MIEFVRILRKKTFRTFLLLIPILSLLLYCAAQLSKMNPCDFLTRNYVYHDLIRKESASPESIEHITDELHRISIKLILSNEDHAFYDIYKAMYPNVLLDPNESTAELETYEWALTNILEQKKWNSEFLQRYYKMKKEYERKVTIPIFAGNQELIENMERTLYDYENLNGTTITLGDDRIITSVVDNKYNILLMAIYLIFLTSQLRVEKDSPMSELLHTLPRGRSRLFLIKTVCLGMLTAIALLAVLLPQFLISFIIYDGASQIDRSIQSIKSFANCMLSGNVIEFFGMYLCFTYILTFSVAMLLLAIVFIPRNYWCALVIQMSLLITSYLGWMLPANTAWPLIKYFNLVSCLCPADILRTYRIFNIWDCYINIPLVVLLLSLILLLLVLLVGIITESKFGRMYMKKKTHYINARKKLSRISYFTWELRKLLIYNKAFYVIIVAVIIAVFMQPSTLPSSDSDIWKQAYLQQIDEGTLQNAKEIIRNELDKSITQIQELKDSCKDKNDTFVLNELYFQELYREQALDELSGRINELLLFNDAHNIEAKLFDDRSANMIWFNQDSDYALWRAIVMIVLTICFSAISFPEERHAGMIPLLCVSAVGIKRYIKGKIAQILCLVGCVGLLFAFVEHNRISLEIPWNAAIQSISSLSSYPYVMTIRTYWLILWTYRIAVLMTISLFTMILSSTISTPIRSLMLCQMLISGTCVLHYLFSSVTVSILPSAQLCSIIPIPSQLFIPVLYVATAILLCAVVPQIIYNQLLKTSYSGKINIRNTLITHYD